VSRTNHGVFLSDGVDLANEAWARAQLLGIEPDASGKLVVPMGRVIGTDGGVVGLLNRESGGTSTLYRSVTLGVMPSTNHIVTAYPTN